MKDNRYLYPLFCLILPFFLFSCEKVEEVLPWRPKKSAKEQYEQQVLKYGLKEIKDIADWRRIAESALDDSLYINPAYKEKIFFSKDKMEASSYRMKLKEGEVINVLIEKDSNNAQIFLDLFLAKNEQETSWRKIIAADKGELSLSFEVQQTGTYQLLIQPEIGAHLPIALSCITEAVYPFPVVGKGNQDIWSFWGDPRGGGKRKHKGIDIFARRGTPLLAIAAGRITQVKETDRGGKVVWLEDEKRSSYLYYAHLNEQSVEAGQWVEVGDTIGTVGNTGNARSTAPHLHFGIYRRGRGAVDPLPFVQIQSTKLPRLRAKENSLKPQLAIKQNATSLRNSPSRKAMIITELQKDTSLEMLGDVGRWYRVRTEDGQLGFIQNNSVRYLDASSD